MTHTAIRLTQSRHFKYSNLYRRLIVKRWILVGCSQIELFQSAFAAETLPCAWPEKASHSEEPWANAHRCVKPHLYDHRISTCFLYGCVGTCWWEFGDPGHENAMFPRGFFDIFDFRSMFCQDYLHSWSQRRDRRIASHFWIVVSEWLCCRNSAACMAGKRYCILRSLGQSPTTVSKSSMI